MKYINVAYKDSTVEVYENGNLVADGYTDYEIYVDCMSGIDYVIGDNYDIKEVEGDAFALLQFRDFFQEQMKGRRKFTFVESVIDTVFPLYPVIFKQEPEIELIREKEYFEF